MKKYAFACVFFSIFLATASGHCSFNIFQNRKINICPVENKGSEEHGYLSESIQTQVYSYTLAIPFLTLTDEERVFLKNLSRTDEYSEQFSQAGEKITYRMIPLVEKCEPSQDLWPINICGSFRMVSEEDIEITLEAHNTISGEAVGTPPLTLPLGTALNNPGSYLTPFFKMLLRYETHTATFEAKPDGSLIFIDGTLRGIGRADSILLAAGAHRLTVKNEGYLEHTDIFSLSEDGYFVKVVLKKPEPLWKIRISSTPEAGVYLDERFLGKTPLDIDVMREPFTITLRREGYRDAVIHSADIETHGRKKDASDAIDVKLIPSAIEQARYESAETYKKQAKLLSYAGFAMLGATILCGVEKTLYEQKADLYEGVDQPRSDRSRATARTFSVLTVSSAAATGVLFGFSFLRILKYFRAYEEPAREYEKYSGITLQYRIGEVKF
jgi:hypothetical protein